MEAKFIDVTSKAQWMWALEAVGGADIYYTPGYLIPLAQRGEGRPVLFFYQNGKRYGLNVVFVRQLSSLPFVEDDLKNKVDLCSPYGYSGPILSENDPGFAGEFWSAWTDAAKELGAVSEFIRFHPLLKNCLPFYDLLDVSLFGHTVYMDLQNEKVESSLSKTCSKNVRTAYKKGLEFELLNPLEYMDEFLEQYTQTMIRRAATQYYFFDEDYFVRLFDELLDRIWLARAHYQGRSGAFGLFLRHGQMIHYHLGCMDHELRAFCPTNLLLFETALLAQKRGLHYFHLGGAYQDNFGLFRFKKSFSDHTADFYLAKQIYDRGAYNRLLESRAGTTRKKVDSNYFPEYRSTL